MGKTAFNPITTKWRGAIGGFRYSVVRGKQVIAERASAVRNPKTAAQMEVRAKFKLATQFSAIWREIINLFLADKNMDDVEKRAALTQTAYDVATAFTVDGNNGKLVSLRNVVAMLNSRFLHNSSNITVGFTSAAQTVTSTVDTTVLCEVVAFNEAGAIIGKTTESLTLTADTAATIPLPIATETPSRYDLMIFEAMPVTEDAWGSITNIQGEYNSGLNKDGYQNLLNVIATGAVEIRSLAQASYVTA